MVLGFSSNDTMMEGPKLPENLLRRKVCTGTIPGGSYLEILETLIVAGIRALFADEPFFIQQDGVPYFYYTDVCACLE
ncbi:hypothetical protein TNCV_4586021 [Trichonephila clavipes]|nr:hypothetical protein TNCV_4586021 [Trichonephila clavipes]